MYAEAELISDAVKQKGHDKKTQTWTTLQRAE